MLTGMTNNMANHTTKECIKNSADGAIEKAGSVALGGCGQGSCCEAILNSMRVECKRLQMSLLSV